MTSPLERARLLDAEMQLQRAWLELNLREMSTAARASPWSKLQPIKLGLMGLSFFKNRSLWLAAISMLMNAYRRRTHKEKR
jgi:hypothetical protein